MFDAGSIAALPDVLLRQDDFPAARKPRLVATGYGGTVRASFSGSTAYLAEAGIENGSLDGAFTLFSNAHPDRGLQARGTVWKTQRLLHRESTSGFKFSGEFSAHVWRRHLPALAGTDVINNFQLFSPQFFRRRAAYGVGAFFYLDGTLHDYLRGYREYDVMAIDPASVERAIDIEGQGYHDADGVFVMSQFAADTLVAEYGLARESVDVVLPGANLSDEMAAQVIAGRQAREQSTDFTVGFVGVYPERKGLPKLAAAIAALRRDKVPVRLLVVGRCPEDIAAMDGVDALGFISKSEEPDRFAEALSRFDLGVQLSTVELSGIAVLEFLRCGIPVLATEVGGITEILKGGGGVGVAGSVSVDDVAGAIQGISADATLRGRLAAEASERSSSMRWQRTAAALGQLVAADESR